MKIETVKYVSRTNGRKTQDGEEEKAKASLDSKINFKLMNTDFKASTGLGTPQNRHATQTIDERHPEDDAALLADERGMVQEAEAVPDLQQPENQDKGVKRPYS